MSKKLNRLISMRPAIQAGLFYCQIIDGRNRWKACQELGIEPKLKEWDGQGSLVSFVVSLNLKRRHLTPTQMSTVAIDILPMLEEEARERQLSTLKQNAVREIIPERVIESPSNGKATEQASEMTGVNARYISDAKRIKEVAPDVFEQMKAGTVEMGDAKREVKKRQQEEAKQEAIASSPETKVEKWDGTIKPNTVSLCDIFDLKLPADN